MIVQVNEEALADLRIADLYALRNDYQQRVLAYESSVDTMCLLALIREIAKRKDNLFII